MASDLNRFFDPLNQSQPPYHWPRYAQFFPESGDVVILRIHAGHSRAERQTGDPTHDPTPGGLETS